LEIKKGDLNSCKMAVLFTDIRGFTEISETCHSTEIFHFLNEYLEEMEAIIKQYDGFIDKFIGDAIMALFFHPKNAITAAMKMQEKASKLQFPNGQIVETGTGIHYGDLILGTVGSHARLETTVIGDTVNIASRLEGLNKYYKTKILFSKIELPGIESAFVCREIDRVRVKGKKLTLTVYEPLSIL
ncbi:MAG: adenylate/guanylate cyclase domain-containing protein, partial [Spirochaetota bacterium]